MIKTGDFIELDYTGKELLNNTIFDTTDRDVAQRSGLDMRRVFKPAVICVGEGQLLAAVDKALEGKEAPCQFTVTAQPEEAFGKKKAALIQRVPVSTFTQQRIDPRPGIPVFVNGTPGTIINVSSGRVLVDFNHPLSSKPIEYTIAVKSIVTDTKRKIQALLTHYGLPGNVTVEANNVTITNPRGLPDGIKEHTEKQIKKLIPDISKVEFTDDGKPTQER